MPVNFELHEAVKSGDFPLVKSLIEEGADVNEADSTGVRPLHWAIQNGFVDEERIRLLALLLRHDASLSAANKEGETPLFLASKKSYTEIVRFLLSHAAMFPTNLNLADLQGATPLHLASSAGHVQVAKLLLEGGL